MELGRLLEGIAHSCVHCDAQNAYKLNIGHIEYDSRKVQDGSLFCCVSGTFDDGHKYAQSAVDKGAAVIMVEHELSIDIPQIVVKDCRLAMAEAAANFYGHPAKGMTIVGVTGTNGKTSTTYMLKSIAEHAGKKVGLIGTIYVMIGDKKISADRTTPASVDLQKTLADMRDEGIELVIMEVSSHSLDQKRVYGLDFEVAAFTNLTQDHLDYHKTFDNYIAAKKLLFQNAKHAVINIDDASSGAMTEGTGVSILTYAVCVNSDIYAKEIEITTKGVQFDLFTPAGGARLNMATPGLFNVYNAMAATGMAIKLGYPIDAIKSGLEQMDSVEGRLERLDTKNLGFDIYLDFAHTPDALENILKSVHSFSSGRIVTLFGCGGDRDRAKRPIMGEVAGRFSDMLIVTSDNPRTENPDKIIEAVMEGVKLTGCKHVVIENRRKAIEYAIENAKPNDCIILAGKGHENYQEINGEKHHFDEKEIVAEIISKL